MKDVRMPGNQEFILLHHWLMITMVQYQTHIKNVMLPRVI